MIFRKLQLLVKFGYLLQLLLIWIYNNTNPISWKKSRFQLKISQYRFSQWISIHLGQGYFLFFVPWLVAKPQEPIVMTTIGPHWKMLCPHGSELRGGWASCMWWIIFDITDLYSAQTYVHSSPNEGIPIQVDERKPIITAVDYRNQCSSMSLSLYSVQNCSPCTIHSTS